MAAIFAAVGYLVAIVIAAPPLQPFLIRNVVPFWVIILFVPIAAFTSMFPIDPDAAMIYIIFGGSNALIYGLVGLLVSALRERILSAE